MRNRCLYIDGIPVDIKTFPATDPFIVAGVTGQYFFASRRDIRTTPDVKKTAYEEKKNKRSARPILTGQIDLF